MLTNNNQWVLFGVDLSRAWHMFAGSWRAIFMAPDSKLRAVLDEPVELLEKNDRKWIKSIVGSDSEPANTTAYLIPESMTLMRRLNVPRSTGVDLATVVAAEVRDASPFLPEDTAFGWKSQNDNKAIYAIDVAIVSKSAIVAFLSDESEFKRFSEEEVWIRFNDEYILVEGFGEHARVDRYKARLRTMGLYLAACVFFLTAILFVPLAYKYFEAKYLQTTLSSLQQQAKGAMRARSELADVNETMKAFNQSLKKSASIVASLEHLTNALPDDAWLNQYEQKENKIEISGTAKNAAALMQKFVDHQSFYDVESSSAIRKVGSSGLETFRIQFSIKSEIIAEGEG